MEELQNTSRNQFDQSTSQTPPPMPDNHLVMAIIVTIVCCLPLGIVAVIKANKVNSLYITGQYLAAQQAADDAKKWSYIAMATGIVGGIIYGIFYFVVIAASMNS